MKHLTYDQIFGQLVKASYQGRLQQQIDEMESDDNDTTKKYVHFAMGKGDRDKVVFKVKECEEECKENCSCQAACLFGAINRDEDGNVVILDRNCTHCGQCVDSCTKGALVDQKEFIPLMELLETKETPVFAIVAPAISGQFGADVSMGQLRLALKHLGFYGMIEVAMFADILSLKEALEFDIHVHNDRDFVLTSCCCPIWLSMVKKVYHDLVSHISPSVSPMVACGRGIKRLHTDAKVVFIGPCVAKKGEAKEADIRDAVDAVLTFQELAQIFEAADIDPAEMREISSEHSATGGRLYARAGGVTQSISDTLDSIRPEKQIKIKAIKAEGVKDCKTMLNAIMKGDISANFYEGMGCVGGCVGGPKALIEKEEGKWRVEAYAQESEALTGAENPYVLELLHELGIESVEELLEGVSAKIFKRDFSCNP